MPLAILRTLEVVKMSFKLCKAEGHTGLVEGSRAQWGAYFSECVCFGVMPTGPLIPP